MKKVLLFLSIAAFFTVSCNKKDSFPEPVSNVKYTDNPPAELFAQGTPYGQTWNCWIDSVDISKSKIQNYLCNWNSGVAYDCGNWYLLSAKKYFGILNGNVYISKSQDWYAISPNTYLQAIDVVGRKKSGIGQLCVGCSNPVGTTTMISYVQ